MMNLKQAQDAWRDRPSSHSHMNEVFSALTNSKPELKAHRDFCEGHNDTAVKIFGFGERSFHWLWKILVDEMPSRFKFLEVGVFRGQVLSLVGLLADLSGKKVMRYGVTPLTSAGGHWESDYAADIAQLNNKFNTEGSNMYYHIIKGLSTDIDVLLAVRVGLTNTIDLLYIDGGHDYETVVKDLKNYLPLLKKGGYLVIDDCCNTFNIPEGMFAGIDTVTKAVDEVLPPFTKNDEYEFLFSVVHNRVYRKR